MEDLAMPPSSHEELALFLAEFTRAETQMTGGPPARRAVAERLLARHSIADLLALLHAASLNHEDDEVDLLCRVLSFLLVAPGALARAGDISALFVQLGAGLKSPFESIRCSAVGFFLTVAQRRVESSETVVEQLFAPTTIAALCDCLADESTVVADTAVATIAALAGCAVQPRMTEGWWSGHAAVAAAQRHPIPVPPSPAAARSLVGTLAALSVADAAQDSTVVARIVSAVCAVAGASDKLFGLVDAAGLLARVASILDSDDALLLLSVLPVLPGLAASLPGLAFLQTHALPRLQRLAGLVGEGGLSTDEEELVGLVGSSSIGAVAEVVYVAATAQGLGAVQPVIDEVLPAFLRSATATCSRPEEPEQLAAVVAALCRILSASPAALDAALGDAALLREWLENGVAADATVRAAVLAGVAAVLSDAAPALGREAAARASRSSSSAAAGEAGTAGPSSAGTHAPGGYTRYERLFDQLGRCCGRDTTEVALAALRRPEPEPRLAAYALLAAAAGLAGGGERWLRRVLGAGGVAPYLLDRSTEAAAGAGLAGCEAKWAVLARAAANPALPALGEPFAGAVRRYVGQGPVGPAARPEPQVSTMASRY